MERRACAVRTAAVALSSVGSQAECSARATKLFLDFSACSRPCKSRCRVYYPASAFWSWREGEWIDCAPAGAALVAPPRLSATRVGCAGGIAMNARCAITYPFVS